MFTVFGLVPYGKKYKEQNTWNIVLLNIWIDTGIRVRNRRLQTTFHFSDVQRAFYWTRYWGIKPTEDYNIEIGMDMVETPYIEKEFKLFHKTIYKQQFLNTEQKWEDYPEPNGDRVHDMLLETYIKDHRRTYSPIFKYFVDGKRHVCKPTVTGQRYYYGYSFLPKCLKWIGRERKDNIWIEFHNDSWMDMSYPYIKNITNSWLQFEYFELPKYIKNID